MLKEIGIGMMIHDKNGHPFLRFVGNDFSDYRIEHSGRYIRLLGSGVPLYYLAIVLEPYGELVKLLRKENSDDAKLHKLVDMAFEILTLNNSYVLKDFANHVAEEVGVSFNYQDVSYWVWLEPSLQFL